METSDFEVVAEAEANGETRSALVGGGVSGLQPPSVAADSAVTSVSTRLVALIELLLRLNTIVGLQFVGRNKASAVPAQLSISRGRESRLWPELR